MRRAWVGYQQRLDAEMASAGFDDRGFPDGRVLRLCRGDQGTTISDIGRQLGITRQGASKIVTNLRDRGYLTVLPSPTNGREKALSLTPRAIDYLRAQRDAVRAVDRQLRSQLGDADLAALGRLLDTLGSDGDLRLRDYLRDRSPLRWIDED